MNMTILERARSIRIHTGLLKHFWADVVNTVMYLINRGPSVTLNCGIPEEAWTGKEVNLKHLRIFGCISFVHMNLDHLSKLDTKSKKCIFIGYGISKYDYQFWDAEDQKILRHKDLVFNEKVYKDLLMERSTSEKDPEVTLGALRDSRMLRTQSSMWCHREEGSAFRKGRRNSE